eukprot:gene17186-18916_t
MVKEEMQKYEIKIIMDIKQDKSRGKKIWDHIKKLRGKCTKPKEEACMLYDNDGNKLNNMEAEKTIEEFWTEIYNKYDNEVESIWNDEIICRVRGRLSISLIANK